MNQTNYGGTNWQVETGKDNVNHFNTQEEQTPIVGIPSNLPYLGAVEFVGRQEELTALHHLLDRDQMTIAAIQGMGGLGKTELALQYARQYQQFYPGGLCWIKAQESDVPIQIVDFARSTLGLPAKDFNGLDLAAQVRYCWSHWRSAGRVLLILDNLVKFESVQPYLPKDARFKVLMTTRLRLSSPVQLFEIQELRETAALDLLKSLVSESRIEQEPLQAKQLCQRLGCLPLGLELVGRYSCSPLY